MEFKGTKGKWEVYNGITLLGVKIGNKLFGIDNSNEESKANALLISKAPEMLEMLIEIRNQIEDGRTYITKNDIKQLIKEATKL